MFLLLCLHAQSLQSCPTICNPMNHNPLGSSVQGILQARILANINFGGNFWMFSSLLYTQVELWCWRTLESPLDSKEFRPVNPKGNQSWIFIGRIDVEAEAPILWPPDEKSWLVGKDPDVGKVWRQEEKGITEDGMVGWHHRLNVQESEQTLGDGEGQGSLACSVHGVAKSQTWLTDWTTTIYRFPERPCYPW